MRIQNKTILPKYISNTLPEEVIINTAHREVFKELEKQEIFIDDTKRINYNSGELIITSTLFVLTKKDIDKIESIIGDYPELKDRLYRILVEGR